MQKVFVTWNLITRKYENMINSFGDFDFHIMLKTHHSSIQ
jgi:3-methyladenine DNA glycosylase Tag